MARHGSTAAKAVAKGAYHDNRDDSCEACVFSAAWGAFHGRASRSVMRCRGCAPPRGPSNPPVPSFTRRRLTFEPSPTPDYSGQKSLDHSRRRRPRGGRCRRDQLEPVRPGLERAHDVRGDADDVPRAEVDDLVVELDPARAADDDVGLLLLAVAMAERRAEAGAVAEVADAEVLGVDVLAGEPCLEPSGPRSAAASSTSLRFLIV